MAFKFDVFKYLLIKINFQKLNNQMCTQLLELYFERDETSPKPKIYFGVEKT